MANKKGMSSEDQARVTAQLEAELNKKDQATEEMHAKLSEEGLPDFSDWSDEQVGFFPYWEANMGDWFYGVIMARDDRDTDFVRYLVQALKPHKCFVGPKDGDRKERMVNPGDFFTISVWEQLRPKFDEYLAQPFQVPLRCEALYKTPTATAGREVWHWRLQVAQPTKRLLEATRRLRYQKELEARGASGVLPG